MPTDRSVLHLLASLPLPAAVQRSLVPDLAADAAQHLARNPNLHPDTWVALYRDRRIAPDLAVTLVNRTLSDAQLDHVLITVKDRRVATLEALLTLNTPTSAQLTALTAAKLPATIAQRLLHDHAVDDGIKTRVLPSAAPRVALTHIARRPGLLDDHTVASCVARLGDSMSLMTQMVLLHRYPAVAHPLPPRPQWSAAALTAGRLDHAQQAQWAPFHGSWKSQRDVVLAHPSVCRACVTGDAVPHAARPPVDQWPADELDTLLVPPELPHSLAARTCWLTWLQVLANPRRTDDQTIRAVALLDDPAAAADLGWLDRSVPAGPSAEEPPLLSGAAVPLAVLRGEGSGAQHRARAGRYLTARLGSDPDAWRLLFDLLDGADGERSLGDVADTAAELARS